MKSIHVFRSLAVFLLFISFSFSNALAQCVETSETISATQCKSYSSPSGNYTWFTSGTYKDTILNDGGCDSVITINLTISANPVYTVSTVAGSSRGFANGTGTSAQFNRLFGVTVDPDGNIYVADSDNNRIRKINTSGVVTTLAGSSSQGFADGTGTSARFYYPKDVVLDNAGNVYVADNNNHRIRKITPSGVVSTFAGGTQGYADGTGTSAQFDQTYGIGIDDSGNLYVADVANHMVRKITTGGVVTTVAGNGSAGFVNGTGTSAQFNSPRDVAVDKDGNLYVGDHNNHCIRKITPSGVVSTFAGGTQGNSDGQGTAAQFYNPNGVAVDRGGNVYVTDRTNHRIRIISPSGYVQTVSGNGQGNTDGTSGLFYHPRGIALDLAGNIYIGDRSNSRVRKITLSAGFGVNETISETACESYTSPSGRYTWYTSGTYQDTLYGASAGGCDSIITINLTVPNPEVTVTTIAGSSRGFLEGTGTSARFNRLFGVTVGPDGNIYVADSDNNRIRKINTSGVVTTLAGSSSQGFADGTGSSAKFYYPKDVVLDSDGNVYVADNNNHRIRKITPSGVVTTFAGGTQGYADGTGTSAQFYQSFGIAIDKLGNFYVADAGNNMIRKITSSGVVTTIAGNGTAGFADGTGTSAQFNSPRDVAVDQDGNIYVGDYLNHRIRKITPLGVVSTYAGGTQGDNDGMGTSAQFDNPNGVAVDDWGNVFVTDRTNHRIRKITPDGYVSTLTGNGQGNTDGTGTSALFYNPRGIALDGEGNLYIGDRSNHRVRKISFSPARKAYINIDVCDSYTTPSGKVWTTTRIENDTLFGASALGCDSIITVNLTVRESTSETLNVSAFNTYTSPSGNNVYTESGRYRDTIPNAAGCDSVIRLNLVVHKRIFVDAGVGSSGNGGTWGTSFKTLKEAIDSANKIKMGDEELELIEIWVKKGTYYAGGDESSTDRNATYLITNPLVSLYGGFSGVETDLSQRNTAANPTVLCGDIGKKSDSSDNAFHVLLILDKRTIRRFPYFTHMTIDGLIIRDGNANGGSRHMYEGKYVYQTEGAGIAIIGSGAKNQEIEPTISNCHFENNYGAYGSIFIQAKKGTAEPLITNCTFKGNRSIYGTIFNDGQGGEVSPIIADCAFANNTSLTSGAAIYNYGYAGESSPLVVNCVFDGNSSSSNGGAVYNNAYGGFSEPDFMNCTFYSNNTNGKGGVMYNFGNAGTCKPFVHNTLFYKNSSGGNVGHKFAEIFNLNATTTVKYSSLQRASSTYASATYNLLSDTSNNLYGVSPMFESESDRDGADDVCRTGDDGLRLSSSSSLINAGGTTDFGDDILGSQRLGNRDIGAYEYVSCGLSVKLATEVKTHTASQAVVDDGFVCYCNSDNELLLALDTNGTGAVISPSQVKLYIGNPSTLSYNSAGGMITNTAGGVILERRWDVEPTTQPSSPVTVRYYYTNDDYDDIVTAMAGLTSPTTITSPSQLQFYKVTGGSSATFPNPHDAGVTGIVLTNGTTASTTVWVNGTHGVQDHSAEYLVSSFSGGGGGGGGGSSPLPVELIHFDAQASANHTADLTWKTASELNNSHFVVERSYNGRDFEEAAIVQGNGTTQNVITYNHNDNTIDLSQNMVFYRLRQVDFDGTQAFSPIRRVDFAGDIAPTKVSLYPNPTSSQVTVRFEDDEVLTHSVKVIDNLGRELYNNTFEGQAIQLDLSTQPTGIYFIIVDTGESFKVVKH